MKTEADLVNDFEVMLTRARALRDSMLLDKKGYAVVVVKPTSLGVENNEDLIHPVDENNEVGKPREAKHVIEGTEARELCARFFTRFWYQDDQDPKRAMRIGAVCKISPVDYKLAMETNTAKKAFKETVKAYLEGKKNTRQRREASVRLADVMARDKDVARAMRRSKMARVSLMHAYREIRILSPIPSAINFTWTTRSHLQHTEISSENALDRLHAVRDDDQASSDRARLAQFMAADTGEKLYFQTPQSPNLRANLIYPGGGKNKQVYASLPLLYVSDDMTIPVVKSPRPPNDRDPISRSGDRLGSHPFLPSINVYRIKR